LIAEHLPHFQAAAHPASRVMSRPASSLPEHPRPRIERNAGHRPLREEGRRAPRRRARTSEQRKAPLRKLARSGDLSFHRSSRASMGTTVARSPKRGSADHHSKPHPFANECREHRIAKLKQMHFALDRPVSLDEFRDLLIRSTLSERRPIDDLACLQGMLDNSGILATCSLGKRLIGIARSVTDFCYCCYLSDLAVDRDFQNQGVGSQLISLTQNKLGPKCKIILLSAPAASQYYPRIGFQQHSSAWVLPRDRYIKIKGRP
jgi:GNAT superfamily N-acetyltransferase